MSYHGFGYDIAPSTVVIKEATAQPQSSASYGEPVISGVKIDTALSNLASAKYEKRVIAVVNIAGGVLLFDYHHDIEEEVGGAGILAESYVPHAIKKYSSTEEAARDLSGSAGGANAAKLAMVAGAGLVLLKLLK